MFLITVVSSTGKDELSVLVNVKDNDTFTNVHKTAGGVSVTVVAPVSATNYLRKNGELTSHLVH